MPHNGNKERQEVSLIGRILSMEALLFLMGCISLIYGIADGKMTSVFWGVLIIGGVIVLIMVRKKDWQKHWEELEAEQKARNERNNQNPPPDDQHKEP